MAQLRAFSQIHAGHAGSGPGQVVFAQAAGTGQGVQRTRPWPALSGPRPGDQPGSAVQTAAGPAAMLTADGEAPSRWSRLRSVLGGPEEYGDRRPEVVGHGEV